MKKILLIVSLLFFFNSCESPKNIDEKDPVTVKTNLQFSQNAYSFYRGVIDDYKMGKNITIQKQLIYISLNHKNSWTVYHSMQGYSFIGSGAYQFTSNSLQDFGKIVGEVINDKGELSHYEVQYVLKNNNYKFTLLGFGGAPNTTLNKIEEIVTLESYLKDVSKTVLAN